MNLLDWILLLAIAGALYLAVRTVRSGKKSGCSGYCAGCPHHCAAMKERK